ncbi:MAG: phospholipase D-like domain-containing protein, partial [Caballeronia sp.]
MRFARLKLALFRGRRPGRLCFTVDNTVRLLQTGEAFFPALIERINAATREVSLETYIFSDDSAGRAVSDALMDAARRGVRVRVITDGIGSVKIPLFDEWPKANIEHRIYNPHLFGELGFSRTHRKLVVIDHQIAFCGGINITDDFQQNGLKLEFARWDFSIETQGPVVADVREAFEVQWQRIRLGVKPHRSGLEEGEQSVAESTRLNRRAARTRLRARRGLIHAVDRPCLAFVARDNLF